MPLIFDEFVSMKSNGRGLGLYIVRELLYRINADIVLLENPEDKILSGANFIIKFNDSNGVFTSILVNNSYQKDLTLFNS